MKIRLVALVLLLTAALAACGNSDAGSIAQDPAASSSPTVPPAGGPGGDSEQFAEIHACLEAAGLADALPSDGPQGDGPSSGVPTDRPSDFPTDGTPPSGFPSGGPGEEAGGPRGSFMDDPEIQAALEACGITVPTGGPAAGQSPG